MQIHPLDPIGAEIEGVDLAALGDPDFREIHRALLRHGVLVFRDQRIAPDEHTAFGRRFGQLEGTEFTTTSSHRFVIVLSNLDGEGCLTSATAHAMVGLAINEQWHTDSSFRANPSTASILAARVLPAVGGDTFFASMRLAWDELGDARRAELGDRRATHSYAESWQRAGGELSASMRAALPPATHPLVRIHPETRQPSLYISNHICMIEGIDDHSARRMVDELVAFAARPGRVYRHRWRDGDVVMWDNRCMLHRAQGFDGEHPRVMHRVTVAGAGAVEPYRPAGECARSFDTTDCTAPVPREKP